MQEEVILNYLKPYEKWVIRLEEVVLFRRKLLAIGLLLIVWGDFAFAYSIKAGFFSSICLLFCTIYVAVVLYAYSGHRIEAALFPPLPKNVKVYDLNEISSFFASFLSKKETTNKKVIEKISHKKAISTGIVLIGIAIFFKFVPPFWFNLIVFNILFFAPKITEIYYLKRLEKEKEEKEKNSSSNNKQDQSNNENNDNKEIKEQTHSDDTKNPNRVHFEIDTNPTSENNENNTVENGDNNNNQAEDVRLETQNQETSTN